MSREILPERSVGSTRGPIVIKVTASGSPYDLTGDTATLDIRPANGGPAVAVGLAHANTPGTAGRFEWQLTAAHVARRGAFVGRAVMSIDGETEVAEFDIPIV